MLENIKQITLESLYRNEKVAQLTLRGKLYHTILQDNVGICQDTIHVSGQIISPS